MTKNQPYIIKEGDYLASIAAQFGCTEDDIWKHPKNEDLVKEGWTKEVLPPGRELFVPATPRPPHGVDVAQANPFRAKVEVRDAHITLIDSFGYHAASGVLFRVTLGTRVELGEVDDQGRALIKSVPATSRSGTVEWNELPLVEYEHVPPPSGSVGFDAATTLAPSRAFVLKPGPLDSLTQLADMDVIPKEVVGDCADRFQGDAQALDLFSHPHHYLATKVERMRRRGDHACGVPVSTSDPWDNRWTAAHPLLTHEFPIPVRKPEAPGQQRRFAYRKERVVLLPDPEDSKRWSATVTAPVPWFNRKGKETHLLGSKVAPVREYGKSNAQFLLMVSAANKRLVALWMEELWTLVPDSDHTWLLPWFCSDEAREHFRRWCQLLTVIGQGGQGAHLKGCAIDIDSRYNPWAPLFSSEHKLMFGEVEGRGGIMDAAAGRAYDRALRLFVAPEHDNPSMQASVFATRYFRNAWDWRPKDLHALYCGYQALNWSLIAYFDYRFGRAMEMKYEGLTPWTASPVTCPPSWKKRSGEEVWRLIEADFHNGCFPIGATLVLDDGAPVLLDPSLHALFHRTDLSYPFKEKKSRKVESRSVLVAPIERLVARIANNDQKRLLGDAVGRQIDLDHERLQDVQDGTQRDPCRGIFNLSYDVVMAFGLLLEEDKDLNWFRMWFFGVNANASGGDFMHLDFMEDRRHIRYLDIKLRPDAGWPKVGSTAGVTVWHAFANPAPPEPVGEDVTGDASTSLAVFGTKGAVVLERGADGGLRIRASQAGDITLEAKYDGLVTSINLTTRPRTNA